MKAQYASTRKHLRFCCDSLRVIIHVPDFQMIMVAEFKVGKE